MNTLKIDEFLAWYKKNKNADVVSILEAIQKYGSIERARRKLLTILRQRIKLLTPPKPKQSKTIYVDKVCPTCKEPFKGKLLQKYCKPNHSPTVKERKRLDKRRFNVDSKPPWQSWDEISRIYENKPEGTHVDHIIPLNHPDVCGLHVPWNLQYLSPEENNYKSNKWDGTYDNISWKNKYLNDT